MTTARNQALDFVKGFLVLGMIVFHAINYFAYQLWDFLLYLKFVSGGFIFISGYIVAALYRAKWEEDPGGVTRRLVTRGLKLIVLFTVINLAINALGIRNFNKLQFGLEQFLNNATDIYLFGRGRIAAFEILLPIGYLLMLSPLFLWLPRSRLLSMILLVCAAAVMLGLSGRLNNLTLLLIGVVGGLLGLLLPPDGISSRKHLLWSIPVLVGCVIALPSLRGILLAYVAYIMIVFKCVADISVALPNRLPAKKCVVLLGEYVLFAYVTHIVLLQLILRGVWKYQQTPVAGVALIATVTCILLLAIVWTTAEARKRFQVVDRAYRLVFA